MAQPIYVTLASTTTSTAVYLDTNQSPFNVGVSVTGSSSGTFSYSLQVTADNQQTLTAIGSTRSPVWITSTAVSSASTANAIALLNIPVAGVRLAAETLSSASLVMCVTQTGPG